MEIRVLDLQPKVEAHGWKGCGVLAFGFAANPVKRAPTVHAEVMDRKSAPVTLADKMMEDLGGGSLSAVVGADEDGEVLLKIDLDVLQSPEVPNGE
nr:hypothetical protein [Corallococcus sp. AS-1-6]